MRHTGCHLIDLKGTDGKYWYGGFDLFGKVWSSLVRVHMEEGEKEEEDKEEVEEEEDKEEVEEEEG